MNEKQTFSGRHVVVTGGGSGIGRAVALDLCARGAEVVVVGRRIGALEQTCTLANSESMHWMLADVSETKWHAELSERFPVVDILVCNAAEFAPYGATHKIDLKDFERVHATILRGSWLSARHLLPGMCERGFGRIVNIGSIVAGLGSSGQSAYASAKAGLVGLTRSLAVEAGRHGVTCNLIEPGLIRTPRIEDTVSAEVSARIMRNTPVGRIGTVEDVAHAVRFLVSDDASYITGCTLPVSGGLGLGLGVIE